MNPEVSVVIPAYNSALYLEETIRSVQNQGYQSWELIIINDGSTDNTLSVAEKIAKTDLRIRILSQENGRQGKARNNGIRDAKGEWIAFLDADDLWASDKLEKQIAKTIVADADLSFTDGYICLNNNMDLRDHRFGVKEKIYQGEEAIQEFHAQNRIPTSSVLIRKKVLIENGMFPEELDIQNCEDYLLWTTLLEKGCKLLGISDPLLYYRVHPASSTGEEVKLLFPLVRALLRMSGSQAEPWRRHLEESFFKLTQVLFERKEIKLIEPLMHKVLPKIYPGLKGWLIRGSYYISYRLFNSMIWRFKR